MSWHKKLSPSFSRLSKSFMSPLTPDDKDDKKAPTSPCLDRKGTSTDIDAEKQLSFSSEKQSPNGSKNTVTGLIKTIKKGLSMGGTKSSTATTSAAGKGAAANKSPPEKKEKSSDRATDRSRTEKKGSSKLSTTASALEQRVTGAPQVAKASQPRLQLDANNRDWIVEFHENVSQPLKIEDAKMNQNIFIRENKNVNLTVEKKFNNLTLENCEGVNVVVQSVISSIELIRCKKCKIQVLGKAQAITIDRSHGINIYVSFESKGIQITNSQNMEINLHVPESETTTDEWVEIPVPCQFVHTVVPNTNDLSTKVSDLYH